MYVCKSFLFRLPCLRVLPDHPRCVPEDGGSEALSDAHQAGPIHLHDLVIHFDPDGHTSESVIKHFEKQSFVQVVPVFDLVSEQ